MVIFFFNHFWVPELYGNSVLDHWRTHLKYPFNTPLTWLSPNLYVCFREKKQKIQDIKNNIKEAIEVSDCVHDIFTGTDPTGYTDSEAINPLLL